MNRMNTVPKATPVTTPLLFTDATPGSVLLHVPGALLPLIVSVAVPSTQTCWEPAMDPATSSVPTQVQLAV